MAEMFFILFETELIAFIEEIILVSLSSTGIGIFAYLRILSQKRNKSGILNKVAKSIIEYSQEKDLQPNEDVIKRILSSLTEKEKKQINMDDKNDSKENNSKVSEK